MSIKITGTGSCLPPLSVTNEELSKILDTSHEWIFSRTGIESRHICENGLTPIAAEAGLKALKDAGRTIEEMDYILCATVSPDYATPSLACMVQSELGGTCPALDIGAASGAPTVNLVAADRHGHIGWTVAGPLPRRVGHDGSIPVSCSDGSRRWDGLLAPDEHPRVVDPPGGQLWSANNRMLSGAAQAWRVRVTLPVLRGRP